MPLADGLQTTTDLLLVTVTLLGIVASAFLGGFIYKQTKKDEASRLAEVLAADRQARQETFEHERALQRGTHRLTARREAFHATGAFFDVLANTPTIGTQEQYRTIERGVLDFYLRFYDFYALITDSAEARAFMSVQGSLSSFIESFRTSDGLSHRLDFDDQDAVARANELLAKLREAVSRLHASLFLSSFHEFGKATTWDEYVSAWREEPSPPPGA